MTHRSGLLLARPIWSRMRRERTPGRLGGRHGLRVTTTRTGVVPPKELVISPKRWSSSKLEWRTPASTCEPTLWDTEYLLTPSSTATSSGAIQSQRTIRSTHPTSLKFSRKFIFQSTSPRSHRGRTQRESLSRTQPILPPCPRY